MNTDNGVVKAWGRAETEGGGKGEKGGDIHNTLSNKD